MFGKSIAWNFWKVWMFIVMICYEPFSFAQSWPQISHEIHCEHGISLKYTGRSSVLCIDSPYLKWVEAYVTAIAKPYPDLVLNPALWVARSTAEFSQWSIMTVRISRTCQRSTLARKEFGLEKILVRATAEHPYYQFWVSILDTLQLAETEIPPCHAGDADWVPWSI